MNKKLITAKKNGWSLHLLILTRAPTRNKRNLDLMGGEMISNHTLNPPTTITPPPWSSREELVII